MKNQWRIVVTLLLVIVVAVFAILNVESVPVSFGFTTVRWPLILLLLVSILIGAVLMILFSTITTFRHNQAYKELEKTTDEQLQKRNAEIDRLTKRLQNSNTKQEVGQQAKRIQELEAQVADLQSQLTTK
ncbi:lipopolysaccharide assembly protein LapA domain-containing protein [Levilactobacillus andaensis]|uniref:lipopolysaccharide assembly protein LapA domain-containing protein n=1 Tax=Levilactobacillus andaensis TaxID=2799570 RepID=UPI001941D88A|nr:LapA family protein [Levilactobacillus andaensis]